MVGEKVTSTVYTHAQEQAHMRLQVLISRVTARPSRTAVGDSLSTRAGRPPWTSHAAAGRAGRWSWEVRPAPGPERRVRAAALCAGPCAGGGGRAREALGRWRPWGSQVRTARQQRLPRALCAAPGPTRHSSAPKGQSTRLWARVLGTKWSLREASEARYGRRK